MTAIADISVLQRGQWTALPTKEGGTQSGAGTAGPGGGARGAPIAT
ncbi:MAG TPA: hypothetical protein VGX00_07690 [Thermoplasmata archaeon]|nr:hypothetical protein [Thermoplasmata archaeon]